jgi:hypothetical protein
MAQLKKKRLSRLTDIFKRTGISQLMLAELGEIGRVSNDNVKVQYVC